jgi:hypothetical protein
MFKALFRARMPGDHLSPATGPESVDRPAPAPWVWPAVVAVAFGPFVLTAGGLAVAALRPPPRPAPEVVAVPVFVPAVAPERPPAPVEEIAADPKPVELAEEPPVEPPASVAAPEPTKPAPARPSRCDRFGTAIDFVRSPALAFDKAARDQKLVMVLHLAGHFDDPGFT